MQKIMFSLMLLVSMVARPMEEIVSKEHEGQGSRIEFTVKSGKRIYTNVSSDPRVIEVHGIPDKVLKQIVKAVKNPAEVKCFISTGGKITDMSLLEPFENIEVLKLEGNKIQKLNLKNFSQLRDVCLKGNEGITRASAVSNLMRNDGFIPNDILCSYLTQESVKIGIESSVKSNDGEVWLKKRRKGNADTLPEPLNFSRRRSEPLVGNKKFGGKSDSKRNNSKKISTLKEFLTRTKEFDDNKNK
jgi:hypothetical protein